MVFNPSPPEFNTDSAQMEQGNKKIPDLSRGFFIATHESAGISLEGSADRQPERLTRFPQDIVCAIELDRLLIGKLPGT